MYIGELLEEYIKLSEELRSGYEYSLGGKKPEWQKLIKNIYEDIPPLFYEIYSRWSGTIRNIENQKYMDFVPGYRLIHIEELNKEYENLTQLLESDDTCEEQMEIIIPFLADCASSYICYVRTWSKNEYIYIYSIEEGLSCMHSSIKAFLDTIIAFYANGVYFLDKDGFLDYDYEQEGIIGMKYNNDIQYWCD